MIGAIVVTACGGCDGLESSSTVTQAGQRTAAHVRTTEQGVYRVEVVFVPDPAPLNQHFGLRVIVRKDGAAPPADTTIHVDADMPAHRHGIHTGPQVRTAGPGRFEVDGILFHMAGDWELYIDVVAGGRSERATFPLTLR